MLKVRIDKSDRSLVFLSGTVDEHAAQVFNDLLRSPLAGTIRLDLSGISLINSLGVSHWCTFLKQLPANQPILLENCASVILDYLNLLPMFRGQTEIVSGSVPAFCEACDEVFEMMVTREEVEKKASPRCPEHGDKEATWELDWDDVATAFGVEID